MGVEAVLDVVVHLVVGPHAALVPVRVHAVVHSCVRDDIKDATRTHTENSDHTETETRA